jgi:ATP-dependent DNA ligase
MASAASPSATVTVSRCSFRRHRPPTRYFPEVVAPMSELYHEVVLDGELVACSC